MVAHCRFGGGRINGFWKFRRVLQPGGQLDAADSTVLLVLFPATASQIAAHHSLHRNRFETLDQHGAPLYLGHFIALNGAFGGLACQVDGAQILSIRAELFKPEQCHLRQQLALARNGLPHDDVKRAQPVACDHQNAVVAHGIVVADLATGQQRQGVQRGGV